MERTAWWNTTDALFVTHTPTHEHPHSRLDWGGSVLRPEATGFGTVFFAANLLEDAGDCLRGKRCLVSGSG